MPATPEPEIALSPDQTAALAALFAALRGPNREAVLAGAAGTGKTTLMRAVLAQWGGGVTLLAPTGKAARRLSEVVGADARTIHSALYAAVEERKDQRKKEVLVFGDRRGLGDGGLVVVDEASMVDTALAADVRAACQAHGSTLLWVGDHEQLPPVSGRWGVPLDRPTACLTQVHRQALESPILDLATCIREQRASTFARWTDDAGACSRARITSMDDAVTWAEAAPDRVLLTWTNRMRQRGNDLTRARRGLPLRKLMAGERIVVTFNQHALGVMNGETFDVVQVKPCPDLSLALEREIVWAWLDGVESPILLCPSAFDAHLSKGADTTERAFNREVWAPIWKKEREDILPLMERAGWDWDDLRTWRNRCNARAVQATYGYVLTAHKSQGSQYREVGFVSCPALRGYTDYEFVRRLTYTAVTRAQETFRAFTLDVPDAPEAD
jgi:exodeoxyribonuclease-5